MEQHRTAAGIWPGGSECRVYAYAVGVLPQIGVT